MSRKEPEPNGKLRILPCGDDMLVTDAPAKGGINITFQNTDPDRNHLTTQTTYFVHETDIRDPNDPTKEEIIYIESLIPKD